jgi:hypothetical protein
MNRLIFRDAPLRTALELYFRTVRINNYIIENTVMGLVTGSDNVTSETFPKALFPGVSHVQQNGVWIVREAIPDERFAALSQNKLACPKVLGTPYRVAGIAFRSQDGPLAIVEQGSPPDSNVRIVALGEHFDGAEVSAITQQGLVLKEGKQRLEIPLTGLVTQSIDTKTVTSPKPEKAFFADAPLASVLEMILISGGPRIQFGGPVEGYMSGETSTSVISLLMKSANTPFTYSKKNEIWYVKPRAEALPAPPRFVSLEDVQQGRVQLPVICGAPRRVAGVLLGEKALALLETGNPPQTKRQLVTEGDFMDGFRVSQIERSGVILQKGERRFLVPLVPLNPIL